MTPGNGMNFFYPYPEPLTDEKPRHIQAWRTAAALAARHPVTMAVADANEFRRPPLQLEILIWPRFRKIGPFRFSLQRQFMERCLDYLSNQPDEMVVYLRHLRLADFLLSSGVRQKIFFEVHEFFSDNEDLPAPKAAALQKMEGRVFLKSAGLVCITQGIVDALRERYLKLPPTAVIPDGCDLPAPHLKDSGAEADLVYAGSLLPWKGVETLVKAMAYLPGRSLRILGGNVAEIGRLKSLARDWGVDERCEFLGHIPADEVESQLELAKVGVVPNHAHAISSRFTSPLKVFECLAAGRPVVASDLPSLREVLDESVARFAPPGSPRSLAAAADRLLKDEALLKKMSEAAKKRAENYTWHKRAERIEIFVQSLTA
jgi:glycosyltransferase involved in cell wall biosynthesis